MLKTAELAKLLIEAQIQEAVHTIQLLQGAVA